MPVLRPGGAPAGGVTPRTVPVARSARPVDAGGMRLTLRRIAWVGIYVGVIVAPLAFAVVASSRPGQGFVTDFSIALGFVGLAMIGLQFVLVARLQSVAAPFGQDALLEFHRQIAGTGLLFLLTHVALSADPDALLGLLSPSTPWRVRFGVLAVLALLALVASSVWRRHLRIAYETWHVLHAALAAVSVLAALVHVALVDHYVDTPLKRALLGLMSAGFVGLLVWVRLVKPLLLRRRPWRLEQVIPEAGRTTTLILRAPEGHGLAFAPGQFAWFAIGRSPFTLTRHPFSIASSAEEPGRLAISVRARGDFTAGVGTLAPGLPVYVDGPHGAFSIDRSRSPGFVFIAGGVGITAILSMLRTMADRGDRRPIVLFYANRDWESTPFVGELDELATRLHLDVVHVLKHPPAAWSGERGRITVEVLQRHLPAGHRSWDVFVCGSQELIDAMDGAMSELGVPAGRVHTERYRFV